MSFSRAKITRFNESEPSHLNQPSHTGNMNKIFGKVQKNERTTSSITRSATTKASPKPRSLSQPSSNTLISKQIPRPYSGGDEKTRQANKVKQTRIAIPDKHSEDDEYDIENNASKIPSSEQIYKIEENTDDERNSDERNVTTEPKTNVTTCKPSSSGIPLRIRQQQQQPSRPIITINAATPRKQTSPRTTASSGMPPTRSTDSTVKVTSDSSKSISLAARRNLETQYQLKKKRMDQLKKEITDKQRMLTDSYQTLVQLNKKLGEAGKNYSLEELSLGSPAEDIKHDSEPSSQSQVSPSANEMSGGGEDIQKIKLDPSTVQNMKDTVKQIPLTLLEMCKNLMDKRLAVIDILENLSDNPHNSESLKQDIQDIKAETENLERLLNEAFEEQDRNVLELVDKWQILVINAGDSSKYIENVEYLQQGLEQKDQQILQQCAEAEEIRKRQEETIKDLEAVINELREKVKSLEVELHSEKSTIQESKDKANLYDQRMKLLKSRLKEMESKQKEAESKCSEMQKLYRQTQDQLKANEHRWLKEKEEMLAKHKHDRQMLDKLTKDRSCFETRMKTLEEMTDDKDQKLKATEEKMKCDVEDARKQALEERAQRESLEQKYNSLKDQLVALEIRNKQALDIVHSRNGGRNEINDIRNEDGFNTEKEAELYTELLSTKVALKAAEDQIQNYNREKLRFIDSIQSLHGDAEHDQEYMAKAMIKNVEKITELESRLAESDETICNQKIEIANLRVEIENFQQLPVLNSLDLERHTKDSDLKMMLHEGRMKLEQSLKKSLEYEHKIIRYEHDLNRQSKQICEMENLLKVRDGLISMIKAKKDELQMENDSLNKYANEIRDLLLQAKEEARNRTELVQELSTNLDSRGRICQQLEKKVKELEGSLTATNEKRFKLQESIGVMEKELHSSKAQCSKGGTDVQSRYDSETNILSKQCADIKGHRQLHFDQKRLSKSKSIACASKSKTQRKPYDGLDAKNIEGEYITNVLQGSRLTGKNNELDMLMEYYHNKLKYLKRTFRTVSNSIFINDINLHTTAQKHGDSKNRCGNHPLTLPASFIYFKPRITTRPEILTNKLNCMIDKNHNGVESINQNKTTALEDNVQLNNDMEIVGGYKKLTETYRNPELAARKSSEEMQNTVNNNYTEHTVQLEHMHNENIKSNIQTPNMQSKDNLKEIEPSPKPSPISCIKPSETLHISKLRKPFSLPVSLRKTHISREKQSFHDVHRKIKLSPTKLTSNVTKPKRISRPSSPKTSCKKSKAGSEGSFIIKKHRLRDLMRSSGVYTEANLNAVLKAEQAKFIGHTYNISNHLSKKRLRQPNSNIHYVPKILSGISRYRVMHSAGSVVWCKPSTEMEVNSVLISHDLMAHSLNKINAGVTSTINLLSKKYAKTNLDIKINNESEIDKSNP